MTPTTLVLRDERGNQLTLDSSRWHQASSPGEQRLLASLRAPVLDVGCGPGRALDALGRRGAVALGIDPAPGAAALARGKGCAVLQRSVFDPLPGAGRWATVLLLDGNIGIGGDPVRLLSRCAALLEPGGAVVVEVDRPGTGWRTCRVRLERDTELGPWFPWAVVGCDALGPLGSASGLAIRDVAEIEDGRWMAFLEPEPMERDVCA